METQDLRILVVAGNPLARTGLVSLLQEQPGFRVIGQVAVDDNLESEVEVYLPDIVLWDLGWEPGRLIEQLVALQEIPVVTLLSDGDSAPGIWKTGVNGLLPQEIEIADLLIALQAVAQGLLILHPDLANVIGEASPPEPDIEAPSLTPREQEVLDLLAQGMTNRGIGHQLGISEHTVKFHVNAIMGKFQVQSRTEAVVQAARMGLLLL